MQNFDISFMNVAMYLRKSRADENNPHETLERHKEILLNYAAEHKLNVLDIYEEVISGGLLFNRAEINKLLALIPSKRYDAVLCIDLDRLGRGSAADSEKIFDVLKENDIKIITLKKVYDLNDEYDEDYSEFEMFMARKELKFITRRMNRGRVKSISEGCFVSGAPFGYRNAVINNKHTLEIYEPEAQFVRMVFDMYVNKGQGITTISHRLKALGVVSKKGTPLDRSTISRMLKNHTYIGKIVWNKSKSVKGQNKQIKTDESTWVYIDGLHESIIDEETFNRAQEMKVTRFKPAVNNGVLKNPLAGLVKCANCGRTMVTNTSEATIERYRLICRTVGCNKGAALSIVENKIYQAINEELANMEASINGSQTANIENDRKMYAETINTATAELNKLHTQQSRLYDLLEQGIYTNDIFVERRNSIEERIRKLNTIISDTEKQLELIDNSNFRKKIPLLREIVNNYYKYNTPKRNAILKNTISKIDYRRDKSDKDGEISLKIHFK